MVIDSSALIAIVLDEPEAADFVRLIQAASSRKLSAAGFLETGIVLKSRASRARVELFEKLISRLHLSIMPITEDQARLALDAFDRYGKGRGHPAGLNFGDCFSYALAKVAGEPLLFKGLDFVHTDILRVTQ